MKKSLVSARNFVQKHHVAIIITVTTVAVVQNRGIQNLNAFLKENGLYEAYYLPEE